MPLSAHERHVLARIEHGLAVHDPRLAAHLRHPPRTTCPRARRSGRPGTLPLLLTVNAVFLLAVLLTLVSTLA
jgi:hypothetical protein